MQKYIVVWEDRYKRQVWAVKSSSGTTCGSPFASILGQNGCVRATVLSCTDLSVQDIYQVV